MFNYLFTPLALSSIHPNLAAAQLRLGQPPTSLARSLSLPPSLSFTHSPCCSLARSLNSSLSCFCAATTPRPRRGWTRDSPRRPSRPRSARRTVSSNYSSLNELWANERRRHDEKVSFIKNLVFYFFFCLYRTNVAFPE